MTSKEAYVWIWLEGQVDPIVCGRIEEENGFYYFNYGQSYLEKSKENSKTFSIYEPELPLIEGRLPLLPQLKMPNAIRDASPDAWGRRVILNKISGSSAKEKDTNDLSELLYLLESGSDRIGALDFQESPTEYKPRQNANVSLEDLLRSTEKVEKGIPLSRELDMALLHGTSIGGARPKALVEEKESKYVAKFSSTDDYYHVVKAEYIAMRLAKLVGIDVAPVKLVRAANKDVLLIKRFDRVRLKHGWRRKRIVSALTLFGLDEMMARYTSYEALCEIIRHRFQSPKETLEELFRRLVFNILCGNTDDHARNHAAFWDGNSLTLTPAYDICPQARSGNEVSQAMLISGEDRRSRIEVCLNARSQFLLSKARAMEIVKHQIQTIEKKWKSVCDEAELSQVDRNLLWKRQFLNPYSMEGVKG
ncbi:HipA domain-containing protein [Leptospira levettii]|uniref:type II toxin-antitoxin system HipA family toxin n=1 Tax=Leptospira levettii TaxID=2023178 RepID=UPI00223E371D|nr:HipA domain-containing protein [Leptospira levettii]MCW7509731.1 HipA domain-containing protein [Leptospira levettii]MCW7520818.1 HipA domain-containing protein [Leptospira levettii]